MCLVAFGDFVAFLGLAAFLAVGFFLDLFFFKCIKEEAALFIFMYCFFSFMQVPSVS